MVRLEIEKLAQLGRMPNEGIDDDESVDAIVEEYSELIEVIIPPLTFEEGQVLVRLFPETSFYDLQWDLLHLVETLYTNAGMEKYEAMIEKCQSTEWRETMEIRLSNGEKKL